MFCISISHKKAPAYIRERYALTKEEQNALITELIIEDIADGAVMLCTCNRCELYVSKESAVETQNEMLERLIESFAEFKQVSRQELSSYLNVYANDLCVTHLFKVCAGLESKVLGEDEILRQVKESYAIAKESGHTTYELNVMFQKAVTCAKRIKTETDLSKVSVSVTTLAANEVLHFNKSGKKIVLLLGITGKIGSIIAKNLSSKEDVTVIATLRNHNIGTQLLTESANIMLIPYKERYQYLDQADIVISATSSPHFTIGKDEAFAAMKTNKNRLFLDLAMPRDIDPELENMAQITLHNIDYFDTVSQNNSMHKLEEADHAKLLMEEEKENAMKEIEFHRCFDKIPEWKTLFEELPFEKLMYAMKKNLDLESMKTILFAFDSLEKWTGKEQL